MVVDLLGPLAAAVASAAAGLVVFSMWNYETGTDVLRENRKDVALQG